jgi:hypothetical protein
MSVRCQKCFIDVNDYVFDKDLKPICLVCSGHKKLMDDLVKVKEEEFNRTWLDSSQYDLRKWL